MVIIPDHTLKPIFDGFVKSPTSALHCIHRHCDVLYVRLIPQNLRALNLELFTLPSKSDFLQDRQLLNHIEKTEIHY